MLFGYKPDEILELFKKHSNELVRINKFTIAKELKNIITKKELKLSGLKSGEDLEQVYNAVSEARGIKSIGDIKMPLIITTVDMITSRKINFCSKKVEDLNYINNITVGAAIRASSSFPVIYEPFEYKEYLFLDGGILDNIPAKEVKKLRSR